MFLPLIVPPVNCNICRRRQLLHLHNSRRRRNYASFETLSNENGCCQPLKKFYENPSMRSSPSTASSPTLRATVELKVPRRQHQKRRVALPPNLHIKNVINRKRLLRPSQYFQRTFSTSGCTCATNFIKIGHREVPSQAFHVGVFEPTLSLRLKTSIDGKLLIRSPQNWKHMFSTPTTTFVPKLIEIGGPQAFLQPFPSASSNLRRRGNKYSA